MNTVLFQLVVNGLTTGAVTCLIAIGFGLGYRTAHFFNFSHGGIVTAGAYFTYLLVSSVELPLGAALFMAISFSTVLGCLLELCFFRTLRNRGSSGLILMVASLGLYIVLQNTVSLVFGDVAHSVRPGHVEKGILVLGARITPIQIWTMATSAVAVLMVTVFIRYAKPGKAIRAVSDSPALAELCGVDSDRVNLWVSAVASAMAGLAGVLMSLDIHVSPTMGMNVLMMSVVAVIAGGAKSVSGIALASVLLGLTLNLSVWKISSQWQDVITFVILLGFLLVCPQGLLGREKKVIPS